MRSGKMAVEKKCMCTKCEQEFDVILPNDNDVWLKNLKCDDCFDKGMIFRSKKVTRKEIKEVKLLIASKL